jgi:hypothetical protein
MQESSRCQQTAADCALLLDDWGYLRRHLRIVETARFCTDQGPVPDKAPIIVTSMPKPSNASKVQEQFQLSRLSGQVAALRNEGAGHVHKGAVASPSKTRSIEPAESSTTADRSTVPNGPASRRDSDATPTAIESRTEPRNKGAAATSCKSRTVTHEDRPEPVACTTTKTASEPVAKPARSSERMELISRTQRASTRSDKRLHEGSTPRPTTRPARPQYYWLRGTSATLVYYNVRMDHVGLFPAQFKQALETYGRKNPSTLYSYAPTSSSTQDRYDVQCSFKLEGQKCIVIRSSSKRAFDFVIDGNSYQATKVTGGPLPGQDWQSLDVCSKSDSVGTHLSVSTERPMALLAKLASSSGLAKTFLEVIQNNHLLLGPCAQQSSNQPCIFSSQDCWRKELDRVDVHTAILESTNQGVVYRTDDSHQPIQTDVARLRSLAWFQTVEGVEAFPQVPHFVQNITVKTLSEHVQVPGMLRNDINTLAQAEAHANFGPTGCSVDLHVGRPNESPRTEFITNGATDHGMHVLSTTFDNCMKLWVTYPPTSSNLDLFYAVSAQEQKLKRLASKLEGGIYALTTGGTTIHLPPGWLHATFNIRGGFLVGIAWENYQDLVILLDIFFREAEAYPEDADYGLIVRMCETALDKGKDLDSLLTMICPLWSAIRRVDEHSGSRFPRSTWIKFEKCAGGDKAVCPGCRKRFDLHNPTGRKRL